MDIRETVERIRVWGETKGWNDLRSFGDHIALMHSELSEALEEYRNGVRIDQVYYQDIPAKPESYNFSEIKPAGVPIELADVLIRIFHFCGCYNIDIESALSIKLDYNETRPYHHGGKLL